MFLTLSQGDLMNAFCDIDLELFCVEIVWCLQTFCVLPEGHC